MGPSCGADGPASRKRWLRGLLCAVGGGWTLLCALGAAEPIRVVGSDLLGPEFVRAIGRFSESSARPVGLDLRGTRPGWDALAAGQADAGLFLWPPGEPAPPGWIHWEIASQVAVVAVPASSSLAQITEEQLRERAGGTGLATGPVLALSPQTGLAWPLFARVILKGGASGPGVEILADEAAVLTRLRARPDALAVTGAFATAPAGVRVLALARTATEPAHLPTPETLASGRYPLRMPLVVTFRRAHAARLRPLLRYLLSAEAAAALVPAHFVGLPAEVRDQRLLELEMME
jgi:phosphate transport system substrate-binding protein